MVVGKLQPSFGPLGYITALHGEFAVSYEKLINFLYFQYTYIAILDLTNANAIHPSIEECSSKCGSTAKNIKNLD